MKTFLKRHLVWFLLAVGVILIGSGVAVAQLSDSGTTTPAAGPTRPPLITPVRPPLVSPIAP